MKIINSIAALCSILGLAFAVWWAYVTAVYNDKHKILAFLLVFFVAAMSAFNCFALYRSWHSPTQEKENRIDAEVFSAFMKRGRELHDRLRSIQTLPELPGIQSDIREWVNQIVVFLREVRFHTEAEVFSQVASAQPSADYMTAVADVSEWKRYDLAQLSIYRKRLEHIKEDRQI
jgi:hypothetical protein